MRKKKGAWLVVGISAVIAFVCLGFIYDFLQGATCWKCWSSRSVALAENKKFWGFSSSDTLWHCHACAKVWRPGAPWVARPSVTFCENQILAK